MNKITVDEFLRLSEELIISYLEETDPTIRTHQLVQNWNFDNGQKIIKWIVENKETDKATIHLIYWLMEPGYSKEYKSREEVIQKNEWYLEDFDLIELIEKNILTGYYKNQNIAFNPYCGHYEVNHIESNEEYKLTRPLPDELKVVLTGQEVFPTDCYDGIPIAILSEFEALQKRIEE